ncbi:hypothetical protein ACFFRR_002308 [Megaselia abdita]
MKVEKSCRVCAGTDSLVDILDPENPELVDVLKICANIEIKQNDKKPKKICQQCKQGFEFAYKLRKLGEENDKKFQEEIHEEEDYEVEALEEEGGDEEINSDVKNSAEPSDFPENDNVFIQFDGRTFKYEQGEIAEEDSFVYSTVEDENEEVGVQEAVTEEVEFPNYEDQIEEVINPGDIDEQNEFIDTESVEIDQCILKSESLVKRKKMSRKIKEESTSNTANIVVIQDDPVPSDENITENQIETLSYEITENSEDDNQETITNFQRNTDKIATSWITLTERFNDEKGKLKYRCTACGKVAKNKPLHIFHVLKHTGENPYKCTMPGCSKAFRSLAGLESHLAFHGSDRNYVCDICNASFKHNTVLSRHKKIHLNNRKFQCKFCSGTFLRRFDCNVHESRHKPNEEFLKPCNLCDKAYLNGLMLKRHKNDEHGVNDNYKESNRTQRTFTCKDCLTSFDGQNALARHKEVCELNKTFKCRFCPKKFLDLATHQDHEENFHDDKWKCKICSFNFIDEDTLRVHTLDAHVTQSDRFIIDLEPGNSITNFSKSRLKLTSISPNQVEICVLRRIDPDIIEKSYACPICSGIIVGYDEMHSHLSLHGKCEGFVCNQCFTLCETSEDLKLHMQVSHESGKAFVCSFCKKVYCTEIGLEQHKAAVHTGKYKYACDFCSRKFVDLTQMKMHVIKKHVNFTDKSKIEIQIVNNNDVRSEKYICGICHRRFEKEVLLSSHMKRHAADYQCKECGRRCKSLSSVRNHMMIHNKVFPFKCEYCEKPFRNAVKLKIHVRFHTGEKPYTCEICDAGFARLERLKLHKYEHVKLLLINQMKEKYNEIKARDPYPVLPSPIDIARKVLAEDSSSDPVIDLKCVKSVKDESDEDEEIEEDELFEEEEIVEWDGLEDVTKEQNLIEEVEVDNKSNIYEVVLHDEESLIVEESDIEMNYMLEDGEQYEETVNVQ